ncbi:low molecular weight protein-tyrosine-phosphatase [Echinimonas agarilytica]|uniref:Low molecular weight phosphotyrosine protein phosphatase n=1 Tax=Echinimonas agarilytica TaxID=1215918 RepID=A0AA41WAW2_9GAMM|nr:low molecular weight protein-tyrosine-phosphatase [Echinimonas agarilytica]MCM2681138.1 low molecular weight phosphotyrosine protein phosphatase [Echinimonas agarilytica]
MQAQPTSQIRSVLMVCMGNICRSPTAEAVFRQMAQAHGLSVHIDSAGTIGHHSGAKPDPRSVKVGQGRGYDFGHICSRKVVPDDFYKFDLILAMDQANFDDLIDTCPEKQLAHKVRLMLEFSSQSEHSEVPDPYYGGARGFDLVLDLIEDASQGLVTHITESYPSQG